MPTSPPTSPGRLAGETIERIVVFRALVLGDLLCAVPALRALRRGFPGSRLALVGLPSMRGLVERIDEVDEFIDFPGHPELPEMPADVAAMPGFIERLRARRFDLAVQLHGSGGIVNAIVARFGARHSAGFFDDDAPVPRADAGLYVRWPEHGHEIFRLLALTDHLGLARCGSALGFAVDDDDRAALDALWPAAERRAPYVVVHAGAQLASRRWPAERFAAVADAVAAAGRTVVLTGSPGEAALAAGVAATMHAASVNLAGRTSLGALGALLEGADALLCNDTGVSHVAAALKVRSVVVSSGADVARWAPLDAERHRVLWATAPCRPCSHAVCPTGHGCALGVSVAQVVAALGLPSSRAERSVRPAWPAVQAEAH